jgi:hypothetical protein
MTLAGRETLVVMPAGFKLKDGGEKGAFNTIHGREKTDGL